MQTLSTAAGGKRHSRLLTFARAHDAQLCAVRTRLTSEETKRLRASLDQLVEMGAIALYRIATPIENTDDWHQAAAYLRRTLGGLRADAAIAAANYPATALPKPQTLIPVWAFERLPSHSHTLTAYGVFMGAPIAFEAFQMTSGDPLCPAAGAASRYAAWREASGSGAKIGTVTLPSGDMPFAVFASVRAA